MAALVPGGQLEVVAAVAALEDVRRLGYARRGRLRRSFASPVLGTGTVYSKLRFLPSKTTVPLVVNHDLERQIGEVHQL